MRIAFYAPMKPPHHPVPSGDRQMARMLIEALQLSGHHVDNPSAFRSWQKEPDPEKQAALKVQGEREAAKLIEEYLRGQRPCPDLWFTYHLYYKAPDWIGPKVSASLAIPYIIAEASLAYKRAEGPWALGHQGTLAALESAASFITLNPLDAECLPSSEKIRELRPFVDTSFYREAAKSRARHRMALSRKHAIDPDRVWLASVAMFRPGDKLASYRLLAEALKPLEKSEGPCKDWSLIVAGGGEAEREVKAFFAAFEQGRIHFIGAQSEEGLLGLYAAADLFVWPAINEAFGMAILEAQASGLPVVAGSEPGVAAIVRNGSSGCLVQSHDTLAFREAVERLIASPEERKRLSLGAIRKSSSEHDRAAAAKTMDLILKEVCQRHG